MMHDRARDPFAKGMRLLRYMMEGPAETVSVREASEALGMPPSTVHRLLTTLAQEGVLRQNADTGQYGLALELYRLAHLAAGRTPLKAVALRYARSLVSACNEATMFNLYDADRQQMMTIAHVESTHQLRYVIDTEHWKPVHVGASGLGIMAFLSSSERQSIIERTGLKPMTERSITDPQKLERELAVVRERGYVLTRDQRTLGAVGLAAPVFGPSGIVLGDICLTIPELRFDETTEPHLAALLLDCANSIMAEIGGRKLVAQLHGVSA